MKPRFFQLQALKPFMFSSLDSITRFKRTLLACTIGYATHMGTP